MNEIIKVANGLYKWRIGTPEEKTPVSFRKREPLIDDINREYKDVTEKIDDIIKKSEFNVGRRGVSISMPVDSDEDIYGFGLQFFRVNQAGKRRFLKVNSDPVCDTGETHAPVPFFASTNGYGVFVDTFRYATFSMGTCTKRGASSGMHEENMPHEEFSESALYALKKAKEQRTIIIDIPNTDGVDIYLFSGTVKECVAKYNLFSGGGVLPPKWGLEPWYRCYGGSNQEMVMDLARKFREDAMPITVLGIEPGWHSHSYSCSYKWSNLFKEPDLLIKYTEDMGYKLNLWEHLFVYPTAPYYNEIKKNCGDYEVWNGLVPDFGKEEGREAFKEYHKQEFVRKGISGFKIDECDNSDFNQSNWSYPDSSMFPSGFDGEQMHQAIGVFAQNVIEDAFLECGVETYGEVRSSGALASPLPFVLYSDLYNHKQFITALVNSGFSGLLWCPEVRDCVNGDDLLRRMQTVIFSHQALINGWRIINPPWKQTDIEKNLNGIEMEEASYYTDECRKLLELRIELRDYLYEAFRKYKESGIPPIRALVMDYPDDYMVRNIDDEYMFGDSILVAPLTYEQGTNREIYFPKGQWIDYFSKEKIEGGQKLKIDAPYNKIPVYVKC